MRLPRPIQFSICLALLIVAAGPAFAADPFSDAARELAAQIAARAGAGSEISLTTRNLSPVGEGAFVEIRRALEAQLRAQGLRVVPPAQAVADVQITLSHGAEGYLWVAEIRQGQNQQVAIVPVARVQAAAGPTNPASMVLRKAPLWSQDDPILDVEVLGADSAGTHLLVLTPAQVVIYRLQGSRGEMEQSQAIPHTGAWPRDLRGRLVLRADRLFDAYLPGVHCSAAGQSLTALNCIASDDPWPLDPGQAGSLNAFFTATRNFFTGILSGAAAQGKSTAPFYSAAKVDEKGSALWILDGTDGRIRLFNGVNETVADFGDRALQAAQSLRGLGWKGWGSDIAAVVSGCGSGTQVLVSRPGDSNVPDSVQAYEIVTRQAIPVSQPTEFPGPVTAFWGSGNAAVAISRNSRTGRYEAFNLTIACER